MAFLLYNQDKWWYKAFTIFLVLALIVAISIGIAPKAKAVGVLTVTVMAAILAVMAGAGIYTVVAGMASNDIQSWMQGKLNQWDSYRNDGNVFTDLIDGNLITVTVKGFLSIGSAAARAISDFISWLKDDLSITDNQQPVIVEYEYAMFGPIATQFFPYFEVHMYLFGGPAYTEYYHQFYNVYVAHYNNRFYLYSLEEFSGVVQSIRSGNITNTQYVTATDTIYNYYVYETINASSYEETYLSRVPEIQNPSIGRDVLPGEITNGGSLSLGSDTINLPIVEPGTDIHVDVGAYPGISLQDIIDQIINAILENILAAQMALVSDYTDAIEAVIINELPISVNTDHHAFGFDLPDITFDFSSIWHYVEDAITYSLSFINWFVAFLAAVPVLAIPLYCCFTIVVVLGAFRRFLL